jgi:hypothetical protein
MGKSAGTERLDGNIAEVRKRIHPIEQDQTMRRLLILAVLCLASCKSVPPPPSEPRAAVQVDVPGVNIRVQEDGGVKVFDPSGRSGVPTVVVPGR